MLTTGVDVPTCKNIVLARVINSMTEFKQIIGRGTRVRDDYGKLYFNILDYTGSATRLFADPDFDGDPALITEEEMDEAGKHGGSESRRRRRRPKDERRRRRVQRIETDERTPEGPPQKYYVDGGAVEIAAHLVYELDADGKQLRVVKFTDYTAENVRSMCPSAAELRSKWSNAEERAEIIAGPRGARHIVRGTGRERRSNRTLTRSTSCATSPTMRPSARAGSGQRAARREKGLLRAIRTRSTRGA